MIGSKRDLYQNHSKVCHTEYTIYMKTKPLGNSTFYFESQSLQNHNVNLVYCYSLMK